MFCDFQKIFNPTEEDKQYQVITRLQLLISLVKDKDCITCKHSECRKAHMHSYETAETFCNKKECVAFDTCDMYEVNTKIGNI